ncbi:MAG: sigma-E processing peptidase SpoIIGA [Bacilli bacterium]|nr:sigma-E processing peptidase SpoIIGA [Bacilli bacterium]
MKVYIDLLLFLNFAFDFVLLLATSIILKRNVKFFNIMLGAFIGSLSVVVLFLNINRLQLLLIKVYLSIIMCLVTFNHKDFKYTIVNITTFYLVSILLGGFLYLLNIEFTSKQKGLIFYNNGLNINTIIIFIISPVILYIYIKQSKYLTKKLKNYFNVDLKIGKVTYSLTGYLDTGNTLTFKGKPVILINKKIKTNKKKILVPYVAIGHAGILECIEVKIYVHNLGDFNVLLAYSESLNISGAEILLNSEMEGKNAKKNNPKVKKNSRKRKHLLRWKQR